MEEGISKLHYRSQVILEGWFAFYKTVGLNCRNLPIYQAHCKGEWGKIRLDLADSSAMIKSIAEWNPTISPVFAAAVIQCIQKLSLDKLPKRKLIALPLSRTRLP